MEFIRDHIKPDAVFYTGDSAPHDDSNSTLEEVIETQIVTVKSIQRILNANLQSTFAMFGNHDVYPFNSLDFENGNEALELIKPYWKPWIYDEKSYIQFLSKGYYSQRLSLITDKVVKVICINSQAFDPNNPYIQNSTDNNTDQFGFLRAELDYLEKQNGIAIIISHIQPDESTHEWSTVLRALLERYQHVIRLSMFGHTHLDEYKLAMSYSNQLRSVGMTTICGSVTTWGGVNPSICVYEIDEETMLPLQRLTYSFNLEEANQNGTP